MDNGSGEREKWFWVNLEKRVGDGRETSFWNDVWVENQPLSSSFPRLYALCQNKSDYVSEKGEWSEGVWEWKWSWSRELRDCERVGFIELMSILNKSIPKQGTGDSWVWKTAKIGCYTTNAAYKEILKRQMVQNQGEEKDAFSKLWKNIAPQKAKAMTWRAMKDKLPTRVNLFKRKVISSVVEAICPICKEEPETIDHLLLTCKGTNSIWYKIFHWLKMVPDCHRSISTQIEQFSVCLSGKKRKVYCDWYVDLHYLADLEGKKCCDF